MKAHIVPAIVVAAFVSACGTPRPAATAPDGAGQPVSAAPVNSAGDLVQLARAQWSERWYRTLSFVQTTTFYTEEGTRSETWHEVARFPGFLRIDLPEQGAGNLVIYRGDSTYVFREGRQVVARPGGNPLLQHGFDLYWQPTAYTLRAMADLDIDTTVVSEGEWRGRRMWIIGAAAGDTTTPQLWFDREQLVFVRLIETDGDEVTDIRFENYQPLGGGLIAPRVEIYTDGRLVMTEDYHDMLPDPEIEPGTFSPGSATGVRWWE